MTNNPLLLFHIASGTIGLGVGYLALLLKKGTQRHVYAGNAFVIAMIAMGLSGALLAWFRPATISVLTGMLMVYLVSTAWLAARRDENHETAFNVAGLGLVAALCVGYFIVGNRVAASPSGFIEGVLIPAGYYYFFGVVAGLCGIGDAVLIARGGLSAGKIMGAWRIARHLWRMCFAFLLAASSLFQGNPQVFPEALRGGYLLAAPVLLILATMIFWLIRVLFTKWYRRAKQLFRRR